MAAGVLERCPICRARLDGDGPCRRCRAELGTIRRSAMESAALAGTGLHHLAAGEHAAAIRLLRRANLLRTTPDLVWILAAIARGELPAGERADPDPIDGGRRHADAAAGPLDILERP